MRYLIVFTVFTIFLSCKYEAVVPPEVNPAAEGFNELESDEKAISIADAVMEANGGRKAWDETDYLQWNFFGARKHIWNKKTGDLIIEGIRDSFHIQMNIHDLTGEVNYRGVQHQHQDSLKKYLTLGKEMWINDAYWLFLPYKLKDSGVTLKYNGTDSTRHVLELNFKDVGKTPNNKYLVYVDSIHHRIDQWDFYRKYTDSVARFTTPWTDYQQYDRILISGSRGENYQLTEISANDSLANHFTSIAQ